MVRIWGLFISFIKIIIMICVLNVTFLFGSLIVTEYITGDEVLSTSIGRSNDLDDSVMLFEDEEVTMIFKTTALEQTEVLNITIIDPQNMDFTW